MVMHTSQLTFEMGRELLSATSTGYTVFWEEERTRRDLECLLKSGMQKGWTTSYAEIAIGAHHTGEKYNKSPSRAGEEGI